MSDGQELPEEFPKKIKTPLIIGISGKSGSGKSTIAKILVEEFGFKEFAFADSLKELAMKYFGLTYDECYGKKTEFSRRILQGLGDFVRKDFNDKWYWILKIENKLDEFVDQTENPKILISDVRYLNEYKSIKAWYYRRGKIIRVERQNNPIIEYGAGHPSETELDNITDWDCIIRNDGNMEELKETVRQEAIKRGWNK